MNKKRLHVLFLPAWYPYDDDPMSGLFVQNHARAIAQFQKVTVVHAEAKQSLSEKLQLSVTEQNGFPEILVYYRKITGNFPLLTPIIKTVRLRQAICKGIEYLEKQYGKPDIIHAHILTRYGVFAYFLSRRWKIPYVITEHWSRYLPARKKEFKGVLRKFFTRLVVRKAAAILPVTQNLAKAMQAHKLHNKHYQVIPNVVDTNLFIPASQKPGKNTFHFIHISCIDNRSKNITGLLDAVKLLAEKRQDFDLTIVGDGPDMETIKTYTKKLGLTAFVAFTGLLTGHNLVAEIQKHHCLVMFSNFENMPVVINEAFACGLPVIAPDVGGISEHLSNDKGLLIKPKDTSGLQDAMLQMMKNYDKYDSQEIRQYAVDNFSYEQVGKQLNKIYSDTIKATSNNV